MAVSKRCGWHSGSLKCYDMTVKNDLSIEGDFTFGDASTDTLTVTGKLDCNGNVDLGDGDDTINIGSGSGDTIALKEDLSVDANKSVTLQGTGVMTAPAMIVSGADLSLTYTGTNTGATPAMIMPDDTYIADANGVLGATAGFVLVKIGSTNFKLQTYAVS